jgi:hypothetical protein
MSFTGLKTLGKKKLERRGRDAEISESAILEKLSENEALSTGYCTIY